MGAPGEDPRAAAGVLHPANDGLRASEGSWAGRAARPRVRGGGSKALCALPVPTGLAGRGQGRPWALRRAPLISLPTGGQQTPGLTSVCPEAHSGPSPPQAFPTEDKIACF